MRTKSVNIQHTCFTFFDRMPLSNWCRTTSIWQNVRIGGNNIKIKKTCSGKKTDLRGFGPRATICISRKSKIVPKTQKYRPIKLLTYYTVKDDSIPSIYWRSRNDTSNNLLRIAKKILNEINRHIMIYTVIGKDCFDTDCILVAFKSLKVIYRF